MSHPNDMHFGHSFASYKNSRLFLEWTKVMDDYKIVWSDETNGLSPEPHLYLDELDIDLFLVGPHQSPKWTASTVLGPSKWDEPSYWGDYQGRFGRLGHSQSTGNLHWCDGCEKVFFSRFARSPCLLCKSEKTFLVEAGSLTWFGYSGPVEFKPTPIGMPGSIQPLGQPNKYRTDELEEREPLTAVTPIEPIKNDLFDEVDAEQAGKRQEGEWDSLKRSLSGKARVHGWPLQADVEKLATEYPNFAEVCDFVLAEISLAPYRRAEMMCLPNILLVGGPSCGKSSFSRRLSQILAGDDWERVDLGQSPTSFELIGVDSGFTRSKEGRVLRLMASRDPRGPVLNPVLILDELDKVNALAQYSPLPALLSLLEKRDASRFRDAFFGVPVDASAIRYLATANDRYAIPAPLLSRFETFSIADYTPDQFVDVVIPNIYLEWVKEFHEGTFPEMLDRPLRKAIAEEVGYVSRRVMASLVRRAQEGHFNFRPVPTWESLKVMPEFE